MKGQFLNFFYFVAIAIEVGNANYELLLRTNDTTLEYLNKLSSLLTEIAFVGRIERCLAIIADDVHHALYDLSFFEASSSNRLRSYFILNINESEDLLAPNYKTVKIFREIRNSQCDMYMITLLNGLQVKRFLKFIDRHRIFKMQERFVFLYDERLFERDMLQVWSSMTSSVFLKVSEDYARFTIYTVAYPGILDSKFVITKGIVDWQQGKKLKNSQLFSDKINNLKGAIIPIAIFPHIPMVKQHDGNYAGLEIEIVRALSVVMNFQPFFYEAHDSNVERWGQELSNGSFTGLLGQLINRKARIAIGDIRLYKLYYSFVDFSLPHTVECLTFLTPESSQDDTWKTLISPFSGAMWAGVVLSLFAVGTVFYSISFIHAILMRRHSSKTTIRRFFMIFRKPSPKIQFDRKIFGKVRFRSYLNRMRVQPSQWDLFDNYENCLLYTYSMLMYVSLPRMPKNWPLRVLTGWYWLYCLLLTVTYRASFTAILANPAARITIDTLDQLLKSRIGISAWGRENKELFENAFDKVLRNIGTNLEITNEIDTITIRIAEGSHAYYDNIYFLRYLRGQRSRENGLKEVLHIMRDCVVQMPVGLGLEKNSPLKSNIDKYIMRMHESGLIVKWLQDATKDLKAEEQSPQEALMDLRKFWSSFVALIVGYVLGVFAIIMEQLHFIYIVRKHPLYDEYNPKLYYNFKRRFPNAEF